MVKLTAAHSQLFFANYKKKWTRKAERKTDKGKDTENLKKKLRPVWKKQRERLRRN